MQYSLKHMLAITACVAIAMWLFTVWPPAPLLLVLATLMVMMITDAV